MDVNLRLVGPAHWAWITNHDDRVLRECRARVETTTGEAFTADLGVIRGGQARKPAASAFRAEGVSWDPVVHPPADLELTCAVGDGIGYAHQPFVSEQADDLDGPDR